MSGLLRFPVPQAQPLRHRHFARHKAVRTLTGIVSRAFGRGPGRAQKDADLEPVRSPRALPQCALLDRGARLRRADPDPGQRHSARACRPRHHGPRPDRHRQDGGFRPAARAAPARRKDPRRATLRARTHSCADARARQPDRRQHARLRQAHAAAHRHRRRRRVDQLADPQPGKGRGHPDRHARPPARPFRASRGAHRQRQVPGAGRGRPDARPRLHPRPAQDCLHARRAAPDHAVFGDHAKGNRAAFARFPRGSGPRRDRSFRTSRPRTSRSSCTS